MEEGKEGEKRTGEERREQEKREEKRREKKRKEEKRREKRKEEGKTKAYFILGFISRENTVNMGRKPHRNSYVAACEICIHRDCPLSTPGYERGKYLD